MPVNGKIGEVNIKEVQIVADVEHEPVILTKICYQDREF